MHLEFDPEPTLVIDNQVIRGVNIFERLHSENSEDARALFEVAANAFRRASIPRIGFRLEHPSAIMPTKRIIDVGYDLTILEISKRLTDTATMYETFVSLEIPLGYYVELVPRSSLSKTGYMLANSVGIIDPCYTGTVKVPLVKVDNSMPELQLPVTIAQLILKPYIVSYEYDATDLNKIDTDRGSGGFGSTN